jgi:hypothetical protein
MDSKETANGILLGQVYAVQYSFPKEALDITRISLPCLKPDPLN